MESIKDTLAQGNVLTVKDIVEVYDSRVREIGKTDERVYSSKRKWMKKCISDNITNIKFESTMGNNSSQRVISTDMNALILHIAEKYAKQDDKEEIAILKRAAQILRCGSLDFLTKHETVFKGSVKDDHSDAPDILRLFVKLSLGIEIYTTQLRQLWKELRILSLATFCQVQKRNARLSIYQGILVISKKGIAISHCIILE